MRSRCCVIGSRTFSFPTLQCQEDGYWLIQQVRALPDEEGGRTPAVAFTAYVRLEDRLRVQSAGFQMYVPKPVEPAELLSVVAQLVTT